MHVSGTTVTALQRTIQTPERQRLPNTSAAAVSGTFSTAELIMDLSLVSDSCGAASNTSLPFSRATISDLRVVLIILQTTGATEPEDPVAAEFVRAAAALKEKLEEHKLCVEDKISK